MRDFTSDELAGYANRSLIVRNLVFVQPRDFSSHDAVGFGFWNGAEDVAFDVVDGLTQSTVTRDFSGGGSLLAVEDIKMVADLSVPSLQVSLSQLHDGVAEAVRGNDMRQAEIQIYRALFSNANPRALVAPARCRFAGFVNGCQIGTPPEGGAAQVSLTCTGCTRELTRKNTDLRSDASQRRRNGSDSFFQYVTATGKVPVYWGEKKAT